MVIILMGLAGPQRSTVAAALAERLGWRVIDPDDHHTGLDRTAWLAALRPIVERAVDRREHLILACSALAARHREQLASGLASVRFVRLSVDSHVATLEDPGSPTITLDASADVDTLVGYIRLELGV